MADHKAARERAAAFLAGQTEHVDPQDLPILEECPICLDTYQSEQPVRIKIAGCAHVFGRSCLLALLTNNPRLEKKCPLCRTVWVKAPHGSTPPDRTAAFAAAREIFGAGGPFDAPGGAPLRQRPTLFGGPSHRHVRMPREQAVFDFSRPDGESQPPRHPTAVFHFGNTQPAQPAQPSQDRVINLIDSEDDQDPLESFVSITRDINSVRDRARNTQGSRRQRREGKKVAAAQPAASIPATIKRENEGDGSNRVSPPSQPAQGEPQPRTQQQQYLTPFSNLFWRPSSRPRPTQESVEAMTRENWGLPPNRNNQDGNSGPNIAVDGSEGSNMDLDNGFWPAGSAESRTPVFSPAPEIPGRSHADPLSNAIFRRELASPRSSSLPQNQQLGAPRNPFLLSPTPELKRSGKKGPANQSKEALDKREKELQEREKRVESGRQDLDKREQELNTREQGLDARESVLVARDRILARREARVQEREGNEDVRHRQLQELEFLVIRHRAELNEQL